MRVKVRKKPVRKAERAKYETIRSYIAVHFEEYQKTHPLKMESEYTAPHDFIEAEKKQYVAFIWEFMNFLMNQG